MSYPNGQVPSSALTTVESKTRLLKVDAPAYYAFRMYAADRGRHLTIAGAGVSGGGGYRDRKMQDEMHRASTGNRALAAKYGLNPNSSVAVAAAGYSSHGWSDHARLDLVGTDLDWIIANAARFDMKREFGPRDPNHFEVVGTRWRHSVPKTSTNLTGGPGKFGSNCWKRVQLLARLGGYDGPIDGFPAERTWAGLDNELPGTVKNQPSALVALQRWAGVSPTKSPIERSAWRKIGSKLNRL